MGVVSVLVVVGAPVLRVACSLVLRVVLGTGIGISLGVALGVGRDLLWVTDLGCFLEGAALGWVLEGGATGYQT